MKKITKLCLQFIEFIAFLLLVFFLRFIGIKNSRKICKILFTKIGPLTKSGKIVRNNLSYISNSLNYSQRFLEKKIWENFGCYVAEFPFVESKYIAENRLVKINGAEILQTLNDQNKNYIVFSAHLANWDIVVSDILSIVGEAGIIYRKITNKFIDNYVKSKRSFKGAKLIPKGPGGGMDLVKFIRQRKNLIMLVDQKMNEGIKVPFLGKMANTASAPALIAREYGYGLVPAKIERVANGKFVLTINQPIFATKSEDKNSDIYNITEKINNIISDWIKEKPQEWFWMHQRWGKPNEMTDK